MKRIITEAGIPAAAHLTCVSATREEVDAVVRSYAEVGVTHIVALRGDPAAGVGEKYVPHEGGYVNAADLVAGIKRIGDFEVSVSAYPEKHPESPDFATDIEMLRRKVDAGATRAITQFFFDNDHYEAYVERVRRAGIFIRSCRVFCRFIILSKWLALPPAPGLACHSGWQTDLKGWKTILRPIVWLQRP